MKNLNTKTKVFKNQIQQLLDIRGHVAISMKSNTDWTGRCKRIRVSGQILENVVKCYYIKEGNQGILQLITLDDMLMIERNMKLNTILA